MDFKKAAELLSLCKEYDKPISQIMMDRECEMTEKPLDEIRSRMAVSLQIMRDATKEAINQPSQSMGGLIGGESRKLSDLQSSGKNIAGNLLSKAIAYSMGVLEVNASMGLIVAAPTAGSSGVIPGVLLALQEEYDYGYGICAPLISKFAVWLYETIKKEAVDKILFAARDGYLMQTLYCMTREAYNDMSVPEGIYFYTSRKAAVMTGINNEAFINMIIDISNGMPPKKMMRERFGLESRDILSYQEEVYGNSIHKYVWAHAEAIFKRADLAKRNYFKYMGNIGLEKNVCIYGFCFFWNNAKGIGKNGTV